MTTFGPSRALVIERSFGCRLLLQDGIGLHMRRIFFYIYGYYFSARVFVSGTSRFSRVGNFVDPLVTFPYTKDNVTEDVREIQINKVFVEILESFPGEENF